MNSASVGKMENAIRTALRVGDDQWIARLAARWPADFVAAVGRRAEWQHELLIVEAAARTHEPGRAQILVAALSAPTPYARLLAARALAKVTPEAQVVEALMAALGDPDALVRKAAIAALDRINDERSADALDAAARSTSNHHHAGIARRAFSTSQRLRGGRVESQIALPAAVKIVTVLVAAGDRVEPGQPLFTFTDGAEAATFCAPHAGEIAALTIMAGGELAADSPALIVRGRL
jgi:hypothetical protein